MKTTVARSVHTNTHTLKQCSATILPAADLRWNQTAQHAHTLAAWTSQPAPQSSPLLVLLHQYLAEVADCCCSSQYVAAAKVPAADDTPAAGAAAAGAADATAAAEGAGGSRFGGDSLLEPAEVGRTVKWVCSGFAALPAASDRLAYT